jgi:hypothetical protein
MSERLYRLNARPAQPQGPLASRGLGCWAWALALALVSALAWVLAMLGTSQKRPGPGRSRTCLLGLIVGDGDGGREGDRWVSTDPGTNASDCGSGSRGASRLELAERATRESGAAGPAKQGAEPGRRHRSGRQPNRHRPPGGHKTLPYQSQAGQSPGGHKTLPYQSQALLGFSPTVYLLAHPPSSSSRPVVSGVIGPTIGLETSSSERVIALPSASART